jgi:hypothetical protein
MLALGDWLGLRLGDSDGDADGDVEGLRDGDAETPPPPSSYSTVRTGR